MENKGNSHIWTDEEIKATLKETVGDGEIDSDRLFGIAIRITRLPLLSIEKVSKQILITNPTTGKVKLKNV